MFRHSLTALTVSAGLLLSAASVPPARAQRSDDFELLMVHEAAAAQSSKIGRMIRHLKPWNGGIYMGYGDYAWNTGPVDVVSWDLAEQAPITHYFNARTEEITNYRDVNGQLWAPSIDAAGPMDYVTSGPDGTWTMANPLRSMHVFDAATFDGKDLWMVGSQGHNAVAWRSFDMGQTWHQELVVPPNVETSYTRFFFIAKYQGKIYLHARGIGWHQNSMVYDGTSWQEGPPLLIEDGPRRMDRIRGFRPEEFAGKLVYLSAEWPAMQRGLVIFDGNEARFGFGEQEIKDFFVDRTTDLLYVLDVRGRVWSSNDAESFELVAVASKKASSLAVVDGELYVGTERSELLKMTRPLASR